MELLNSVDVKSKFYIFCIDFESVGGVPKKNGFTEVGACWMDSECNLISTFHMKTNLQGYELDKRCWEEFWMTKMKSETPRILSQYEGELADSMLPEEVIKKLWEWCDEVMAVNCIDPKKILKIGDCISYDVMMLGCFSDRDVRNPFGDDMEWVDVSSLYAGMSRYPITADVIAKVSSKRMGQAGLMEQVNNFVELPKFKVKHTHSPCDDAINITLYFLHFFLKLQATMYFEPGYEVKMQRWLA